jgi:hypothetical protein
VVHYRVGHPTESATKPQRGDCAATQRNTTTNYYTIRNSIILFRSITIIYILYFYLAGAGIMPNLTITATAPLCAHPLCRRLTVLTVTGWGLGVLGYVKTSASEPEHKGVLQ